MGVTTSWVLCGLWMEEQMDFKHGLHKALNSEGLCTYQTWTKINKDTSHPWLYIMPCLRPQFGCHTQQWVWAQILNLWWKINFPPHSKQNWLTLCSSCPPALSPSSILFSLSHISCKHLIWLGCWRQAHLWQFQTVDSISSYISTNISKWKRLLNFITLLKNSDGFLGGLFDLLH